MTGRRSKKVPRAKRIRATKVAPTVGLNGATALRQLSTAAIAAQPVEEFTAIEGAHRFLYRLCGVVARVHASSTRLGPVVRLFGEFVALDVGKRWFTARAALVPESIGNAVLAQFREHPKRSTRDRVRVYVLFDVWSIRRADSVLGYELIADGRAWVPNPMGELIKSASEKPIEERAI
jgi:hypothetical protein